MSQVSFLSLQKLLSVGYVQRQVLHVYLNLLLVLLVGRLSRLAVVSYLLIIFFHLLFGQTFTHIEYISEHLLLVRLAERLPAANGRGISIKISDFIFDR